MACNARRIADGVAITPCQLITEARLKYKVEDKNKCSIAIGHAGLQLNRITDTDCKMSATLLAMHMCVP